MFKFQKLFVVSLILTGFWIVSANGFTAARDDKKPQAAGDAKAGAKLFAESCKQCHKTNGTETVVGPGLKGLFSSRKKLQNGKPVTDENVRAIIKDGRNLMPGFGGKYKAAQIDDLTAYLKTL